jgi:hypothetical protein
MFRCETEPHEILSPLASCDLLSPSPQKKPNPQSKPVFKLNFDKLSPDTSLLTPAHQRLLKKPALTQRETPDLVFDSCLASQLQNLFMAIKTGTREKVRDCIWQTPDIDAFDPITGHTALTYALAERRF